jgi:DNA (cytosine-5)-methyltransferase 1
MTAYYNEIEPYAVQWLRNLIDAGLIAKGHVDDRDIRDVTPGDLAGYTQCHFFAGIGGWSLALRQAGWPDDRPVWTGSCPCQPFSAAGKGAGFTDERHVWPDWFHLISVCKPPAIYGEQVASSDGLNWFDLVRADLEAAGYAVAGADLCAAGIGAPHIRQRLYWFADGLAFTNDDQYQRTFGGRSREATPAAAGVGQNIVIAGQSGGASVDVFERLADTENVRCSGELLRTGPGLQADGASKNSNTQRLADSSSSKRLGRTDDAPLFSDGSSRGRDESTSDVERCSESKRMGDPIRSGLEGLTGDVTGARGWSVEIGSVTTAGDVSGLAGTEAQRRQDGSSLSGIATPLDGTSGSGVGISSDGIDSKPSPLNGFWRTADWLYCRDGKWRPVRSGSSPLAHGVPNRMGRLRAYGNAILPQVGAIFVKATQS